MKTVSSGFIGMGVNVSALALRSTSSRLALTMAATARARHRRSPPHAIYSERSSRPLGGLASPSSRGLAVHFACVRAATDEYGRLPLSGAVASARGVRTQFRLHAARRKVPSRFSPRSHLIFYFDLHAITQRPPAPPRRGGACPGRRGRRRPPARPPRRSRGTCRSPSASA